MAFGDTSTGLLFRVRADASQAQAELQGFRQRVGQEVAAIERSARGAGDSFRGLGSQIGLLSPAMGRFTTAGMGAAGATGAISLGLIAAAKAGVQYQDSIDKLTKSFTFFMGSQQAAIRHLRELQEFADRTPFEFLEVAEASQKFQNMGIAAQEVIPLLSAVGEAVARAGGSTEQVQRVAKAISDTLARGKVSAQEMNQLANNLVDGWGILERQLGKNRGELMKMTEAGEISGRTFVEAFRQQYQSGEATRAQMQTLTGALTTLKDAGVRLLGEAFSPLHAVLKDITVELAKMVTEGWNLERSLRAAGRAGAEVGTSFGFRAVAGQLSVAQRLGFQLPGGNARDLANEDARLRSKAAAQTPVNPNDPFVVSTAQEVEKQAREVLDKLGTALEAERAKVAEIVARALSTAADTAYREAIGRAEQLFKVSGDYLTFIQAVKTAEEERWEARKAQFAEERAEIQQRDQPAERTAAELKRSREEEAQAAGEFRRRMDALDAEVTERHLAELRKRHDHELELFDLRTSEIIRRQRELSEAGQISFRQAQDAISRRMAEGFRLRYDYLIEEQNAVEDNADAYQEVSRRLAVLNEEAKIFRERRGVEATAATIADLDRLIDRAEAAIERMRGMTPVTPGVDLQTFKFPLPGGKEGPVVDPAAFEAEFGKAPNFQPHIDAIKVFRDSAVEMFSGVAQGFGSMVNAILMGEKVSGKAFAAMAKSAIASIAAEAAVRALFELAMGLASMWLAPQKAAGHFAAAKVFGVVAAMGAGAALAIPGGGGGSAAGNEFSSTSSNVGRGSERDRTIREARFGGAPDPNQPQLFGHVAVDLKYPDGHVEQQLVRIYDRGGAFRGRLRGDMLGEATG